MKLTGALLDTIPSKARQASVAWATALLTFLIFSIAEAAPLAGEWNLNGSTQDTFGGPDAILQRPRRLDQDGYRFRGGNGLALELCGIVSRDEYEIEIDMSLARNDVGYQRIISFDGEVSDEGFYAYDNYFYFYDESPDDDTYTFLPNTMFTLKIARQASTKTFTAELDGQNLWSFTDSTDLGVMTDASQTLQFFTENRANDAQTEYAQGFVSAIRVYGTPPATPNCAPSCRETVEGALATVTPLISDPATPPAALRALRSAKHQLEGAETKCSQTKLSPSLNDVRRALRSMTYAIQRGVPAASLDSTIDDLVAFARRKASDEIDAAVARSGSQSKIDRARVFLAAGDAETSPARATAKYVLALTRAKRA